MLGALAGGAQVLPQRLAVSRPGARVVLENSGVLDADVRSLVEHERLGRLTIEWGEYTFRRSGTQRWPAALILHDVDALAEWLGREAELEQFCTLVALARERLPAALSWLAHSPQRALAVREEFPRMLDIALRLQAHPRPGRYVRELDVPGVDSKFVETYHAALAGLLDAVLAPDAIDRARRSTGPAGFARRFGFAFPPPRVRLRLLDPALAPVPGLSDLELPVQDLAAWPIPCTYVFITENKISGLSFPHVDKSIVLFGMGHALRQLESVTWLHERTICYWGDIDTHGFAMLSALRRRFPQTRSLLMDLSTLFTHRDAWGTEAVHERWLHPLDHLDADELNVFDGLRNDRWGESVRLEQERIAFAWLQTAIKAG